MYVGVVGLGYVGTPLAEAFARAGYRVIGYGVSEARIDALRARPAPAVRSDGSGRSIALASSDSDSGPESGGAGGPEYTTDPDRRARDGE